MKIFIPELLTMKNETIACVIPFYNGSATIERAVKSVYNQIRKPDEFIIVNDGSTQDEIEYLEKLSEKYDFLLVNQENEGQGSSRNRGVNESKSELICFLDQDDFFFPDHISELLKAIPKSDHSWGYIFSDYALASLDGKIQKRKILSLKKNLQEHIDLFTILKNDLEILPSSTLISRYAFLSVNGFDPKLRGYEDDDLFVRMFENGFSSYYLDKTLLAWCRHKGSTSFSILMFRSRFLYLEKLILSHPNDSVNNINYISDCIVPRFIPQFIKDATEAKLNKSKHLEEILTTLYTIKKLISNTNISLLPNKKKIVFELNLALNPSASYQLFITNICDFKKRLILKLRRTLLNVK